MTWQATADGARMFLAAHKARQARWRLEVERRETAPKPPGTSARGLVAQLEALATDEAQCVLRELAAALGRSDVDVIRRAVVQARVLLGG